MDIYIYIYICAGDREEKMHMYMYDHTKAITTMRFCMRSQSSIILMYKILHSENAYVIVLLHKDNNNNELFVLYPRDWLYLCIINHRKKMHMYMYYRTRNPKPSAPIWHAWLETTPITTPQPYNLKMAPGDERWLDSYWCTSLAY